MTLRLDIQTCSLIPSQWRNSDVPMHVPCRGKSSAGSEGVNRSKYPSLIKDSNLYPDALVGSEAEKNNGMPSHVWQGKASRQPWRRLIHLLIGAASIAIIRFTRRRHSHHTFAFSLSAQRRCELLAWDATWCCSGV